MYWITLLGIAIGLAMDAFAVSIAAGLRLGRVGRRQMFRLAFHFGLFQAMMPVLGWLAGSQLAAQVRAFDHWIAFGLLSFVGGRMLLEARREEGTRSRTDPTRGLMLVTLSVATSIDALAVGLSMAFLRVSVWVPAVVIGLVAAALTAMGITFGSRLGPRWGTRAHVLGGCILLLIGLKILVGDLMEHGILPANHANGPNEVSWQSREVERCRGDIEHGKGVRGFPGHGGPPGWRAASSHTTRKPKRELVSDG